MSLTNDAAEELGPRNDCDDARSFGSFARHLHLQNALHVQDCSVARLQGGLALQKIAAEGAAVGESRLHHR